MTKICRPNITRRRAEIWEGERRNAENRKERAAEKNSPENKLWELRMRMVQNLTSANSAKPEERVANTQKFVDLMVSFIVKEFQKLSKVQLFTTKKLNDFVENYSIHMYNLIAFDYEMVYCENPQCDKSMIREFNNQLQKHIPVLLSRFINVEMERDRHYRVRHKLEDYNV